jgi:hypothetical protein
MSVARLKELINRAASDDRISLAEVQDLIDVAIDEGTVTVGEAFLLNAALDAHAEYFTPDAFAALKGFLQGRGR